MRLLGLLFAAAIAGCAVSSEPDDVGVGDESALASTSVTELAPIDPDFRRVNGAVETLLGPPVGAGRRIAAIRALSFAGKRARLVVDVDSFTTSVVSETALAAASTAGSFPDAPYPRSLGATANSALVAIDAEATFAPSVSEPFTLTVDMCQSSKPFERRLFTWAAGLSDRLRQPVPMGIAMTGGWARAHSGELDEILGLERSGKIAITWINHSSTHPLNCRNASCSDAAFLTASSVDFKEEVLGLERALLSRNLVPSPIFRFPGLVHDAKRRSELSKLSLMAIDANAWIAKGEQIRPRSVVLVHGNGNEAVGITGFLKAVESEPRASALVSGASVLVSPLLIAPTPPR